jgi:hypothetical protein
MEIKRRFCDTSVALLNIAISRSMGYQFELVTPQRMLVNSSLSSST